MKQKKKNEYLPLDFAKRTYVDIPDRDYIKYINWAIENKKFHKTLEFEDDCLRSIGDTIYTSSRFLDYKQVYHITPDLAEDLFMSGPMDFPIDNIRLPFPVIFIDMPLRAFENTPFEPVGVFLVIDDNIISEGERCPRTVVTELGHNPIDGFRFTSYSFNHKQEGNIAVDKLLKELTFEDNLYEDATHIFEAAAYLSQEKPDVIPTPAKEKIYHPAAKPIYASIREWDVGIRYMTEKRAYMNSRKAGATVSMRTGSRVRPHIRKAHWHLYRVGPGRKETKLLWIPPVFVGKQKDEDPVVVRKVAKEMKGDK